MKHLVVRETLNLTVATNHASPVLSIFFRHLAANPPVRYAAHVTAVTIPIPRMRFVNGRGGPSPPLLIMRDYVAPANVFGRNVPSNELKVHRRGIRVVRSRATRNRFQRNDFYANEKSMNTSRAFFLFDGIYNTNIYIYIYKTIRFFRSEVGGITSSLTPFKMH